MPHGFADRSTSIRLYDAWAQFRDYQRLCIIPGRLFDSILWYLLLWQVWTMAFLEHLSSVSMWRTHRGRAGEISLGGQTWFCRALRSVLEQRVGCTSKSLDTQFADSWEVVSLVTTTTRTISECFLYVCFQCFRCVQKSESTTGTSLQKMNYFFFYFCFLFCSSHWHIQILVYNKDLPVLILLTFLNPQIQWGLKEQILQDS